MKQVLAASHKPMIPEQLAQRVGERRLREGEPERLLATIKDLQQRFARTVFVGHIDFAERLQMRLILVDRMTKWPTSKAFNVKRLMFAC